MLSAVLLALLAQTADPRIFVLEAPENVWDVAVEDLNQNGVKDILVLSCDERSYPLKKHLSVYLSDEAGGFPRQPDYTLDLDPMVGTVLIAEEDGVPPREILAADSAGITVYRHNGGNLKKHARIDAPSLLPSMVKEPLFLRDAAKCIDGDGIEEWFLPQPTGYEIRTLDGVKAFVKCDVAGEVFRRESMRVIYRLPAYHTFEYGPGPERAIAFLSDEFADFAHGPNWSQRERFRIPVNLEEKWEASAGMGDINANGFPDLVVTQTRGTVNLEARTQVYLAEEPFKYPDTPTAEFVAKGGIASPVLIDIDGDGMKDILVIGISFNVRNIISFFVRGNLTVTAEVHLFNGTDFGKGPAFKTNLTLQAPEGREQVAYALADFNGDGRVDLAFGESARRMVVKLGEPDRFVSNRNWATLDVPGFGVARNVKLEDKPGEDLLLFHPASANAKRVHVIRF